MEQFEQLIPWYQKMIDLWEEDANQMNMGLGGEMLESYRMLIEAEKEILKEAKRTAQTQYIYWR